MSFQAPLFLLGLLAVPAFVGLYALAQRRSRRFAVRFPAAATLRAVLPETSRWHRHIPTAVLALGVASLVTALARPEATVAVPVERASVMLVTDSSGSMSATDVDPSRLQAAREAASGFLDKVPEETQVGVIGFSDSAHTVVAPTGDRDAAHAAIDALTADGGTATGDALQAALDALTANDDPDGTRPPSAIVLLSDGKRTVGAEPVAIAEEAARLGIPVSTVALGTPDGVLTTPNGSLTVPPDPETLRQIAEVSRGEAFSADDGDELDAVYERLGSQIGTKQEQREITVGFAAGGLLLLGAALAGSLRRSVRLP